MMKLINNKVFIKTFLTLSFITLPANLTSAILSRAGNIYTTETMLLGLALVLVNIPIGYLAALFISYKTIQAQFINKVINKRWLIWIFSLISCTLFIYATFRTIYVLNNHLFPQGVGFDQNAYWFKHAPLIFLGLFSIVILLLGNIMSFFLYRNLREKQALLVDSTKEIN